MEGSTALSSGIISAITDGCTKVVNGATEGVSAILPLGMEVMALTLGIRIAIGFFRSLAH
ncbi:MAG: hypothetical protein ACI4D4_07570 [Lachnospira sp.]